MVLRLTKYSLSSLIIYQHLLYDTLCVTHHTNVCMHSTETRTEERCRTQRGQAAIARSHCSVYSKGLGFGGWDGGMRGSVLTLKRIPLDCSWAGREGPGFHHQGSYYPHKHVSQDRVGPTMRIHSLELVFEIKPLAGLCKGTGKRSSSEGPC